MANFEPPPTHTDPVSQDEATGAWRFNPHWLKWFVDLANELEPGASYELTTAKDTASGYAGLNAASRTTKGVITTDDLIVDLTTKGLVLKDPAGTPHYWRVTVSAIGALVITDIGTTAP